MKMRISTLIIIFLLFPEIIGKSLSLFNCLQVDNFGDYSLLIYSTTIKCWDKDHINLILVGAFPGLLVWAVIVPLIILILLYRNSKRIKSIIKSTKKVSYQNIIDARGRKSLLTLQRASISIFRPGLNKEKKMRRKAIMINNQEVVTRLANFNNIFVTKFCLRVAAIAPWLRLCLPTCGPGFESQAKHLRFFNLY